MTTTAARILAKAMSEDDLLKEVIKLARLLGITVAHFRPALSKTGRWVTPVQGDGKGYPDCTLAGTRVLFRELKSETGTLSQEQKQWIHALTQAGADVAVWKPRDWHSGLIRAQLEGIRVSPADRRPSRG